MTRGDDSAFAFAALGACVVAMAGWALRDPPDSQGRAPPPLFDPAAAGAREEVRDVAALAALDRRTAADAAFAALRPPWARGLVLHATGDAAFDPAADSARDVHLVFGADGVPRGTGRLARGERAPAAYRGFAADSLHALFPAASARDESRDGAARAFAAAAARAFGSGDAVRFSFELEGAEEAPPEGFDPARLTPRAEELGPASRRRLPR